MERIKNVHGKIEIDKKIMQLHAPPSSPPGFSNSNSGSNSSKKRVLNGLPSEMNPTALSGFPPLAEDLQWRLPLEADFVCVLLKIPMMIKRR